MCCIVVVNQWETNSVNKVVLTFISGLVGFLRKVMTSVHGYDAI